MPGLELIEPRWPRHPRVRACFTLRRGGVSQGPYASLNLGLHVGDDPAHVASNRQCLVEALGLSQQPCWLDQVHGVRTLRFPQEAGERTADAAWTDRPGVALAVMSADCLPVLLADDEGRCVAAAHAGWRGLAAGVIESALTALPVPPAALSAWLGPAIGAAAFEVGPEVREAFVARDPRHAAAFTAGANDRFMADLYALARRRLAVAGVQRVYGGDRCTHDEPAAFFSHRRDGRCGRMAALVWLDAT